jgi:hypothetical protein
VLDWAFIAVPTRAMLHAMRHAPALGLGLWIMPAAGPGEASAAVPPAYASGVEIATSFSKQEALDRFALVKQDHADLLGSLNPMVVETCDLHMGTDLQYSVRIGMDSRDDANKLCAKLQAAGGACIVQKN